MVSASSYGIDSPQKVISPTPWQKLLPLLQSTCMILLLSVQYWPLTYSHKDTATDQSHSKTVRQSVTQECLHMIAQTDGPFVLSCSSITGNNVGLHPLSCLSWVYVRRLRDYLPGMHTTGPHENRRSPITCLNNFLPNEYNKQKQNVCWSSHYYWPVSCHACCLECWRINP